MRHYLEFVEGKSFESGYGVGFLNKDIPNCPFCGGTADAVSAKNNVLEQTVHIECDKCGARTRDFKTKSGFIKALEGAVLAWSSRWIPDADKTEQTEQKGE